MRDLDPLSALLVSVQLCRLKVSCEDDQELLDEFIVLAFLSDCLHHAKQLWRGLLIDLQYQETERVGDQIVLGTRYPLNLEHLCLLINEHLDLINS